MKTLVAAKIKFKQINKLQKKFQKKTTKVGKKPERKKKKRKIIAKK